MTKKILTLTALLFLGLVFNCEKTETIEHEHESIENTDSRLSRISINDLIQSDKSFSRLSENYLFDKIKGKGTSTKNSSDDLIITSDTINVIEEESYKSYTIRIKRSGYEYDTENLIIEQRDSIENAYILSYDFDNEWLANHVKGIHNLPKGKIYYSDFDTSNLSSKTSIAKSSGSCHNLTISIIAPCGCGHYYRSECSGCSSGNQYPTSYTTTQLVCDSGGGSDNDFGSPLPTSDDGLGGSGGGLPSPGGGSSGGSTQTNLEDMTEFVEFKINNLITRLELNDSQVQWITNNNNIQKALNIYDYVAKENSWANDAKEFAKLAVEAEKNNKEVDYEEEVINELKDKALCVYDKLKSSSTGFKNAIKKFDGEFPVSHLKFDMGDIGASRGKTIAPNNNPTTPNSPDFVITVRINNNNTNSGVAKRPNLLVVKTIAHEVIHAEMYRKLLSVLDNGGNIDGVTRQDVLDALDSNFPGMYDYFRRHKNWQHQQMATHYRETLARILQEYNTGSAVPDNQQPAQLYMDLSWEGLRYPNIHTWTSLSQTERDRIDNVISDYIANNSNETCTE